jgi:hypothetical protein
MVCIEHVFFVVTFIWHFAWHMCICDGNIILLHMVFKELVEPLHSLKCMVRFLVFVIEYFMLIVDSYILSDHVNHNMILTVFYDFLRSLLFYIMLWIYIPSLIIYA